ncbi:MAG: PfkB family carbohydrate kinase [Planctomycetota bacterium]
MSLIATGTVGIDSIYTPDGEHREAVIGGSCAHFCVAAQAFGPVRLVSVVGEDFPEDLYAQLAAFENIDLAGLERRAGSKTFRWGGKYQENMDDRETLFTELGVYGEGEAPITIPDAHKDSKTLFCGNAHPAAQMHAMDQLPDTTLVVADTMNLWIEIAAEPLRELLTRVDGLVLNYEEAEQLTGERGAVRAGKAILEKGPKFVIVKKGEHGALLIHREGLAALPAYPADRVVDPTGAGDSFAGGLMAHLAETGDASFDNLRGAMAKGTVIASYNIEDFSFERIARLTSDELQKRYADYVSMIRLD